VHFYGTFEPNIICCDTDYVKKDILSFFHCSYLEQYTSLTPGAKKSKECVVSYDSMKRLYSELRRNLQEIKFHPDLQAAASKQRKTATAAMQHLPHA
jgi:hypothetical protein